MSFNGYNTSCTFTSGAVAEYYQYDYNYTYYTNLDRLLEAEKDRLHNGFIWVFAATDTFEAGKYQVTDKNADVEGAAPELTFTRVCDLDMWQQPYVARVLGGTSYYTLEEAIENGISKADVINIALQSDYTVPNGTLEIPWSAFVYRIPYNYNKLEGSFDHGVTYDDGWGGYCYYSDLEYLFKLASLYGTYVWVWTDEEGFMPGKYVFKPNTGSSPEVFDEETGNYTTFSMGYYTLTWIDDISKFENESAGNWWY